MKIRQGFVSNSSSSSFILGVAEILDSEKFYNYIKENNIELERYGVSIVPAVEAASMYDVEVSPEKGTVSVSGFSYDTVTAPITDMNNSVLIIDISNDEGDYSFWNERYGEMEYDIDLSYFGANQQKLYALATAGEKAGLGPGDTTYGAARNG